MGKVYLDVLLVISNGIFCTLKQHTSARPMNITQDMVITALFQSPAQQPCILKVINGNSAVALEAKVQKIEILCNDGCSRAGEIEGEGVLDGSEVM